MCWKMLHAQVHETIPGLVLTCVAGQEKSGTDATRSTEPRLKTLSWFLKGTSARHTSFAAACLS